MRKFTQLTGMFLIAMLLLFPSRIFAEKPPNASVIEKGDVNNELPPGSKPKNSTPFNVDTRSLINLAVEDIIGLSPKDGNTEISVRQAVGIISFAYLFMYDDHGFLSEFRKNRKNLENDAIYEMKGFENRDISEFDIITREELIHTIVWVFRGIEVDKSAVDPANAREEKLTLENYTDSHMISKCYRKQIREALINGYVVGTTTNELQPQKPATLNDLVAILERTIHLNKECHPIRISYMQFQSAWSEFNCTFLKVPSHTFNLIAKIFTTSILPLCFSGLIALLKLKYPKKHKQAGTYRAKRYL